MFPKRIKNMQYITNQTFKYFMTLTIIYDRLMTNKKIRNTMIFSKQGGKDVKNLGNINQ